jgi:hypothetical protein
LILAFIAPGAEIGAAIRGIVAAAEAGHATFPFAGVVPAVGGIALAAATAGGLLGDRSLGGAAWAVEVALTTIAVIVIGSALEATTQRLRFGFVESVVGGLPSTVQATRRASGRNGLLVEVGRASRLFGRHAPQPHAFVGEKHRGAGEKKLTELQDRVEAPALKEKNAAAEKADGSEKHVVITCQRRFEAAHEVEKSSANGQHDANDAGPIQTGINHSCGPPGYGMGLT